MPFFDGLATIFTDLAILAEPINYISVTDGSQVSLGGIWHENPIVDGMAPGGDTRALGVSFAADDVPTLQEGDIVERVKTQERFRVVTHIDEDGFGMVMASLEKVDA